ncbi:MAG: hypothetical protein P8Y52_01395 [Xanthomonadales bacterium]
MANRTLAQSLTKLGPSALALLLCASASAAVAAESGSASAPRPANEPFSLIEPVARDNPFAFEPGAVGGLEFDLGDSRTQQLQLQLQRPLSLQTGARARVFDSGSSLLGLDATLNVPLADSFNLSAGVERQLMETQFRSVGSIECHNGILRADSYTASGCRFINEPLAISDQRRVDLGARIDFDNSSASVNWFTQQAESGTQAAVTGLPTAPLAWNDSLLSPTLGDPLVASAGSVPLQFLNSEATGVDLRFKVGIATDNSGDIHLGLAFGRILDAEFQGAYANSFEALSWTVAEAFNTARMNVEWSRGAFSGGVQGFYREPVNFLDRSKLDSLTTFDVHFTWHTPWNADLSVGTSNVLDAGNDAASSVEAQPIDPLESIYGRIPYVRYKQDL